LTVRVCSSLQFPSFRAEGHAPFPLALR